MTPAVERLHAKHESAIFVKTGITIESASVIDGNDVEVLEVKLKSVAVTSVYKSPGNAFQIHTLRTSKPQVAIGDFNNQIINWGYREFNLDGEAVKAWAKASHFSLVDNAKLPISFSSGRWKQGYNPHLALANHSISPLSKKMEPIPKSQHRPIGIIVTFAVSTASIPNRRRFNLKKVNWKGFSDKLEYRLQHVQATLNNYDRFSETARTTARHNIPRGCCTNCIPGLTTSACQMYFTYKRLYENDPFDHKTMAAGEEVINAISEMQQSSWRAAIEDLDIARNSQKTWKLIGKLNNDYTKPTQQHSNITANQIAHQLLLNGKTPRSTRQLKPNLNTDGCNQTLQSLFV